MGGNDFFSGLLNPPPLPVPCLHRNPLSLSGVMTDMQNTSPKKSTLRRFLPLIAILAGFAALWFGGAKDYVSLEALAARYGDLTAFVQANWLIAALVYVAVYAISTGFVVPVGTPLAMAGGMLFGLITGTSLIVIGATIGAAALFLAARSAVGDSLRQRGGAGVQKILDGLQRDQAQFLLVLRLVPLFPFWLVNLAPGFANVRLWTYTWTTFLGIIPGTAVHAYIGVQLGKALARGETLNVEALFKLAYPPLLALGALSLIPLAYRWWQRRNRSEIHG
jgi:uncharacterized membrane protein YdjX (TVP38/TMEM64 family)